VQEWEQWEDWKEDRNEVQSQAACRIPVGRLGSPETARSAVNPARSPRVADLATSGVVSLPGWFTCAQARAVLQLKGCSFALISDARGASRVASREHLAAARPDQMWAGVAVPLAPALVRRGSDGGREADRPAGARAFAASIRVEDARDVADEHLAERRESQPAAFQVQLHQAVALEAA